MTKKIIVAVPLSLIAAAALALSMSQPITAESVIGYASVYAVMAVLALEYRITWRRLLGRS